MTAADDFGRISAVLSELAPDADIRNIEVTGGDGTPHVVTVQTRTLGRLLGPRGETAGSLRAALVGRLGDQRLQLNIAEAPPTPPPDERPPDGPGVAYPPG